MGVYSWWVSTGSGKKCYSIVICKEVISIILTILNKHKLQNYYKVAVLLVFSPEKQKEHSTGSQDAWMPFNPANDTTGAVSVSGTHPVYDLGSVLLPLWALVSVSTNWA